MFGKNLERIHIWNFISRHHHGAEAEKSIEALGAREIARIFSQNIKSREVERGGETENGVAHLAGFEKAAGFADDDPQLAFGIHFATAVVVLLSAALLFAV